MGSHVTAPGEQLGVRCLAQGHLSRCIEGGYFMFMHRFMFLGLQMYIYQWNWSLISIILNSVQPHGAVSTWRAKGLQTCISTGEDPLCGVRDRRHQNLPHVWQTTGKTCFHTQKSELTGWANIFTPILWLIQSRLYIELHVRCILKRTSTISGIPQIVLMTKVDEACPLVEENLHSLYLSSYIKSKVRRGHMVCCYRTQKGFSHCA